MVYFLFSLVLVYMGILTFMTIFQRKLLYFPDKNIGAPEQYGLSGFKEEFVASPDGVMLQFWYKPAVSGMQTIVYFHGNASHIGNRSGIYSALSGKGFGVLAVSYRGYGKSEGEPSEQGIYDDARTAIHYLLKNKSLALEDVVIYGESLGTGVGVQMASEFHVAALVLQAPYRSVTGRAAEIYFYLPVTMVIRDHFDSIQKIAKINSPLLILHGELDTTIPIQHGQELFAAANERKQFVAFPDVGHNNFDSTVIAEEVEKFVNKNGATRR